MFIFDLAQLSFASSFLQPLSVRSSLLHIWREILTSARRCYCCRTFPRPLSPNTNSKPSLNLNLPLHLSLALFSSYIATTGGLCFIWAAEVFNLSRELSSEALSLFLVSWSLTFGQLLLFWLLLLILMPLLLSLLLQQLFSIYWLLTARALRKSGGSNGPISSSLKARLASKRIAIS